MRYLLISVSLVSVFLLFGCAHGSSEKQGAATLPRLNKVIDGHAHFDNPEMMPSEKMKAEYAENNVVAAVVHEELRQTATQTAPSNYFVCAAAKPERRVSEVEAGIKSGRYRCIKIYLGYVHRWATDPVYAPYYKLAEKYDVPVVFHTGDTLDKDGHVKYADPLTIDEIAVNHRKVTFVIAHLGNPWFQSAAEVVYKNVNVYADTSALMIGDLDKYSPETVNELLVKPMRWFFTYVENPKKLMFGTDWNLVNVGSYLRATQQAIPPESWDDVFYNNAARVFKIK